METNILKPVSCPCDNCIYNGNETAKDIKKRRSTGKKLKVTFQHIQRAVSPKTISRALRLSPSDTNLELKESDTIPKGENQSKTTIASQKKTEGGKGGGGGGTGGKLDKLPEYLRETVDWFMG